MTDISVSLGAKRKRGRPRKDSNLSAAVHSSENSTFTKTQLIDKNSQENNVDAMIGSTVYGVIEGSFDAGYLISVRIGNNHTPFRGVVFQPRKFVPLTASNDVAPQARMYHRREMPIPTTSGFSPHSQVDLEPVQASKQAVLRPTLPSGPLPVGLSPYSSSNQSSFMATDAMMMRASSCSNMGDKLTAPESPKNDGRKQFSYVHPTGSLRMVEEDDVMQAFEVSTSSGGSKNNVGGEMATNDSFPGKEISISQKDGAHGKAVESDVGPSIENMTQSTFQIQQDEMGCRELDQPNEFVDEDRLQSPTSNGPLQEVPVPAETQLQPTSNQYYNVNFHQNILTAQSQPDQGPKSLPPTAQFHRGGFHESPNLKLDLAFSVHENQPLQPQDPHSTHLGPNYSVLNGFRNPNMGYHQALVAGNPLLLPPDLAGEPLEFMMEKPKSPRNFRTPLDTNERFHGEEAVSPSASYKLELATPQSALNTRHEMQTSSSAGCITDMDFVFSDAIRPTEARQHESGPSEAEHR